MNVPDPPGREPFFLWETHGIHVGTGEDHVKHGIDNLEQVVERALSLGLPALSFVIHTPRLTSFRYGSERATEVKFIRGDSSYFTFTRRMEALKERYRGRIAIRSGVELEWLGSGLGLQWSRAKLFQAYGVDFVIGSVHFSPEGIPYDGSKEETERLILLRGGPEAFWAAYLDEVIEMVDAFREMIHVVGHLDLPKLFTPLPEALRDLERGSPLASRACTLLEMVSDFNLALDLNLSGLRKGCGIYPHAALLKRACRLGIPLAVGTDTHSLEEIGQGFREGLEAARGAGYRSYVSFSRGILENRSLNSRSDRSYRLLNLGIEMLDLRFEPKRRLEVPKFSFGGRFGSLSADFPDSVSLGGFQALRLRRDDRSLTLSDEPPENGREEITCLFSHHQDIPGTLSVLFNTLASEEINVETAFLSSLADGTATAYLTLSGPVERVREASEFVLGTASDRFFRIEPELKARLPGFKQAPAYLLEVDGVSLPIPISRQMIVTVHDNRPGVLLILLSALASRNVNVLDLQLGRRGDRGFAVLGVEGDAREVSAILPRLGPQFREASHILLKSFEDLRDGL